MLDLCTAIRFDGNVSTGKTRPIRLSCEKTDGTEIEVVAKLSARCMRGVGTLVIEALTAMLAIDLGLPIPKPVLIQLSPEFIGSISNNSVKQDAGNSVKVAFGSSHLPPGFTQWPRDKTVPKRVHQTAAEIFAFDGLVENADRGKGPLSTNCMVRGEEVAIIDHDEAFPDTRGLLLHKPPWETGSMQYLKEQPPHIFATKLKNAEFDLSGLADNWKGLTDQRLNDYLSALPPEWNSEIHVANNMIGSTKDIRDNIDDCLIEIERVLRG